MSERETEGGGSCGTETKRESRDIFTDDIHSEKAPHTPSPVLRANYKTILPPRRNCSRSALILALARRLCISVIRPRLALILLILCLCRATEEIWRTLRRRC